jgi:hypothetical protein
MDELRIIDLTKEKFECDGRTFYRQSSLSFNRYRELQRVSIEFGFSRTFLDVYKSVQKSYDLIQTAKNFGDVAVSLYNILAGIGELGEKEDPALRLCALFLNEADEDVAVYDELKMKSKIECWAKELDVSPFLAMASGIVSDWMPVYKLISQNTLKRKPEKAK